MPHPLTFLSGSLNNSLFVCSQPTPTYGSVYHLQSGRRPLAKVINKFTGHHLAHVQQHSSDSISLLFSIKPVKSSIVLIPCQSVRWCCLGLHLLVFSYMMLSSFRASPQGQTQTYCPLCPPHPELPMPLTTHTTTTIITITAAIYPFVCYHQLWYSLCAVVYL